MSDDRLIVALDVPTAEEAVRLANAVRPHVAGFKVGLELLLGPGPAVVGALAADGSDVFADAKLHDIPTTVERAVTHRAPMGTGPAGTRRRHGRRPHRSARRRRLRGV